MAQRLLSTLNLASLLSLAVTALGLALRIEHAITFDGPVRGSDYVAYVDGVRWMLEHKRAFNFDPTVSYPVRYQPPGWYAAAAVVLALTHSVRMIAGLSVVGWLVRQLVLWKVLKDLAPDAKWSRLAALALHAVLPLSVLIDGKVNPEGLHSALFAVGCYVLFRIERQANEPSGISWRTAATFGLVSGLALLTKATSAVLLITAGIVLLWYGIRSWRQAGWKPTWKRLLQPALLSLAFWCLVAGWWCGPNIRKYGHPFPHDWDIDDHTGNAIMSEPTLYRRPLGWALPFEWQQYRAFPIIRSPDDPRPNFWAVTVTGTWSDFYNRGFCRLKGKGSTSKVWAGEHGPTWWVSTRCVRLFVELFWVGALLTIASVIAVLYVARSHVRSGGRRGSVVLPVACILVVGFIMMFAIVYPFDSNAVLNPRYLLPIATPMTACFGLGLAAVPEGRWKRTFVHLIAFAAIATLTVLVLLERFGR